MQQTSVHQYVERVVDLTDPDANQILNFTTEDARNLLRDQPGEAMLKVAGSFALVAQAGKTVKMARSLDRPMRYFLAKRSEGPMLIVASRIDAIYDWLQREGFGAQFHPSYTRMVPAHHVVEIQLMGITYFSPFLEKTSSQGLKYVIPLSSSGILAGLHVLHPCGPTGSDR
jgi:asparagine synthase (glutamine-hydrolysing)